MYRKSPTSSNSKQSNEITNILVLEFERNVGPERRGIQRHGLPTPRRISRIQRLLLPGAGARASRAEQNQDDSGFIDTDLRFLAMRNQQVQRVAARAIWRSRFARNAFDSATVAIRVDFSGSDGASLLCIRCLTRGC